MRKFKVRLKREFTETCIIEVDDEEFKDCDDAFTVDDVVIDHSSDANWEITEDDHEYIINEITE